MRRTPSDDRLVRFYGQWTSAEKRAVRSAIESVESRGAFAPPRDAHFAALWHASIPKSRTVGKRFTVYRSGHPHVLCASTLVQICQQIQALAESVLVHGAPGPRGTNGLGAGRSSHGAPPAQDIAARLLLVGRGQTEGTTRPENPQARSPQTGSQVSSCFAFTARDVLKQGPDGELDLRQTHDALDALAQQDAFDAADGILIDLRSTAHPLTAESLFELVAHIARMERGGRCRRIAVIVAGRDIDRAEFEARCVRQQISNMRSFEDARLARAWLDPHAYIRKKSDV